MIEQLSQATLDKIIAGVVKALRPIIDQPKAYYTPPELAKQLGTEPAKVVGSSSPAHAATCCRGLSAYVRRDAGEIMPAQLA